MENKTLKQQYEIGMVGLGVMGRNLLLNMADHGFSVAGYDKDLSQVGALRKEAEKRDIHCTANLQDFISSLQLPRTNFKDTDLRTIRLKEKGILFMGMGISGGEDGARHGASIMPGGLKEAFDRVKSVLEAVSAKVNGEPCVTYLGPMSAGHFVKMVHK